MKTASSFLLALATSVCLNAQTSLLQLVSPLGGEAITPGQPHTITWNTDADSVKITLRNIETGATTVIAQSTAGASGSKTWNVPSNLAAGGMYRLKIEAVGNAGVYSWSKGYLVVPSGGSGKAVAQESTPETPKPSLLIWPQPAAERFGIQWSGVEATRITLRSPTGSALCSYPTHGTGAMALFSTEGLAAGVYFVEVLGAGGQRVVEKVVVNR